MQKIWKISEPASSEFLKKFPEYQKITLQMLWDRGLKTQKEIDEFFNPDYDQDLHDPFLLKDVKKTLERIEQAAKSHEKVAIFADYDADGICGAVLLHEVLEIYNINPEVYIPDRNSEGYGLNLKAVEQISKRGVKLILTIDCGITDVEEVKLANELNMDVIIVDHHEIPTSSVGRPKLPAAFAIINPKQKKCKYPFKKLAGAGVAFKLFQAARITKNLPVSREKWLLDLAAIATVTDSMLILGENRTIVKYGLIVLSQTKRLGLQALMEKARIKGNLNTYTIGFILGPRINAASRVDHGTVAFRLLLSKDKIEAGGLADSLELKNQERQRQMERIFKEARTRVLKTKNKKKIIFEADETWTSGLAGLIAQKLKDEFWRPAFICQLSKNHAVCSARGGVAGFDVIDALDKCKGLLEEYGGHPFAGAFRADVCNLGKIQKILEKTANKKLKKEDIAPFLNIDAEIEADEINWKVFEEIERFQPFGSNNTAPLFVMRKLKIIGMKNVGSRENHLKLYLEKETKEGIKKFSAIGFNLVNSCAKIELGDKIDIVFEILANEWNNTKELEFKIMDLKKI
ncbi:single-stranded-DNA-specific exonuclease RecJ [Patescibacteria group bacterium]|nr:single-stranded-DNA-specific exonuclease RecJ [Patescibacteria group bacterium]MBU4458460.1 single-stranded-DNA-specific exonuclease RecJ [Patescibacteria group bacterium]MCG2695990.1 single-stranded-DNA-specific exonuclease RecJ [Candidatus Portnoybacteria bacterium]